MSKEKSESVYIIVDFDGTVVTHAYPLIGEDIGSVPVLKELVNNGHKLILFTMRCDTNDSFTLTHAVNWFKKNDIPLFGIQVNPTQKRWTSSPKAYGHIIIDDTSLFAPLKVDKTLSERPFIDWSKVNSELIRLGLIHE
jgi:hypothetical protein